MQALCETALPHPGMAVPENGNLIPGRYQVSIHSHVESQDSCLQLESQSCCLSIWRHGLAIPNENADSNFFERTSRRSVFVDSTDPCSRFLAPLLLAVLDSTCLHSVDPNPPNPIGLSLVVGYLSGHGFCRTRIS